MDTYLEIGQKRVFAAALDWPGWCRSGRDEDAALRALLDYAPRYAAVAKRAGLPFSSPDSTAVFTIMERLPGGATTDFGAPEAIPASDRRPLGSAELARFGALLAACWSVYDAIAAAAPRGGPPQGPAPSSFTRLSLRGGDVV